MDDQIPPNAANFWQSWTEAERERVDKLLAADAGTHAQIGTMVGRSMHSIDKVARQLGHRKRAPSQQWPQEAANKLEAMARSKQYTFSQIARELGMTRNAVIGKACRMGLAGLTREAYVRQRPIAPRITRPKRARDPVVKLALDWRPKERPIIAERSAPPQWLGLGLLDLTNESCRYPAGEGPYTFCGDPSADFVGGQPYCSGHRQIAYYRRAAE